ncbi:hypothetical protein B0A49_07261 [Cryomyces minteri]|uniref:Nuclear control of ATPase protein 2 n=1 Tax=Cryomyces minteri TaxID=331657 RepID=A0A4U0WQY6_9PEZI|nr:hypothetical protein B0A49_07261 [Cryomyces minteri]
MSFVVDQIRRIDSQLDRLQLSGLPSSVESYSASALAEGSHDTAESSRIENLQSLIKSLSTTSSARYPLSSPSRIEDILQQASLFTSDASYEHDLEWLLVSKATVQVYGAILNTILESTIPLSDDLYYWDDILGSYRYTALYSIQTSPSRIWEWGKDVYTDVRKRGHGRGLKGFREDGGEGIRQGWRQFYGLVREVVREKNLVDVRRRIVGPVALIRGEVKAKQAGLRRVRTMNANALGVLLGEGLGNESMHGEGLASPANKYATHDEHPHRWKGSIARSIALMEAVLVKVSDPELSVDKFDAAIAEMTDEDPYYELYSTDGEQTVSSPKPMEAAGRLRKLLQTLLPEYQTTSSALVREHGKPSRLIRYWLPVAVALISSTTVLRIIVNRKAEILTWIRELGTTIIDFWSNWVVEPTKRVIGTIRHDESSEVSIMSKRSLEGDRASLERMVVDFAVDNPEGARPLNESEIASIRAAVKEGDLTPVLKAYERDLAHPFTGTVRGNLIRALLIQIQKTKVDVEVAMGGIDALLKSQELVFGFVGLTPGVLVTVAVWRWLSSTLGSRRGSARGRKHGQMVRELRNIDRILSNSRPTEFGELYYKDQGLLLCEVHVLRQTAEQVLPAQLYREFLEEVQDLVDIRTGVQRQLKVVERMRWAYAKWF